MNQKKVVLFLQGPHSPFFSRLADRLEELGHRALRINLCFSDYLFWRRGGAWSYRGRLRDWRAYLDAFYGTHRVTDLILHGEQREYHKIAIDLAKSRGVDVTVSDWGYLRPDWLTLERNGMTGATHFTKDPLEIIRLGMDAPDPDLSLKYTESFFMMALCNVCGDIGNWLLAPLYPGYRSHALVNPVIGYLGLGMRLAVANCRKRLTLKTASNLAFHSAQQPYFVFPMQLEGDFQIRAYSRYSGMNEVLAEVVASFARGAPASTVLVIKIHPWDPGLKPWRKIVRDLAQSCGVSSRVMVTDGGSFEDLAVQSKGIVTVNSTCGVSALRLDKPVKTLGDAIYDIPGLTHQGELDSFWTSPTTPDPRLRDAHIRALAACIQIKGGLYSNEGISSAVQAAAERLAEGKINQPLTVSRNRHPDSPDANANLACARAG